MTGASAPVTGWTKLARSADRHKKFHLFMMVVWAALLPPTLIWWKESVLWVAIMSLYANFAGHFAAYEGASE
jgi:hypothetical protein